MNGVWTSFNPPAERTFQATNPVCAVTGHSTSPDPVLLTGQGGTNRSLSSSFQLTVNTTNLCGTRLQVEITTRDSGSSDTIELTPTNGNTLWTVSIPTSFQSTRWSAGDRDVTVYRRTGNSWAIINPDLALPHHGADSTVCDDRRDRKC